MNIEKSSNIAMNGFKHVKHSQNTHNQMSLSGTLNKTLLLTLLVFIGGYLSWSQTIPLTLLMPVMIGTLVLSLIIIFTLMFKPMLANILAPIYSIAEGVFLGMISLLFEGMYPGIVVQAILLTLSIALVMNLLYRNKIIKVTKKFQSIIIAATLGIFAVYMISMVMSFFGTSIPLIHEGGPIGIIFSLFVVTIASLNLLLDFHFIDKQIENKMPKGMEWYGAFTIMVTLIWIYIEVLKLLSKIRSND